MEQGRRWLIAGVLLLAVNAALLAAALATAPSQSRNAAAHDVLLDELGVIEADVLRLRERVARVTGRLDSIDTDVHRYKQSVDGYRIQCEATAGEIRSRLDQLERSAP